MTKDLASAAEHIDTAIDNLISAMSEMPTIAQLVVEPIISVLGPLAARIRQVSSAVEDVEKSE